jgi:hypothetical protein
VYKQAVVGQRAASKALEGRRNTMQQVARRTPIDMGDGTAYDKVYEHGYAEGDRVGYVIIL